MRIYEGHDSPYVNPKPVQFYVKSNKACCFCDHCTDIFWDYSNGPYMMFCDIDQDYANESNYNLNGECKNYKEERDDEDVKHELKILQDLKEVYQSAKPTDYTKDMLMKIDERIKELQK